MVDSSNPKNKEFSSPEQRYLPRWHVKNRVEFQKNRNERIYFGETKDLNSAGACMMVKDEVLPKQKLSLIIYLTSERTIKVNGEVVWIKPLPDKMEIGINFHDITEDAQHLILEHAFAVKKNEVVRHWYEGWDGQKEG